MTYNRALLDTGPRLSFSKVATRRLSVGTPDGSADQFPISSSPRFATFMLFIYVFPSNNAIMLYTIEYARSLKIKDISNYLLGILVRFVCKKTHWVCVCVFMCYCRVPRLSLLGNNVVKWMIYCFTNMYCIAIYFVGSR